MTKPAEKPESLPRVPLEMLVLKPEVRLKDITRGSAGSAVELHDGPQYALAWLPTAHAVSIQVKETGEERIVPFVDCRQAIPARRGKRKEADGPVQPGAGEAAPGRSGESPAAS